MTKMNAMKGASARISRRFTSLSFRFSGLVMGPKNIFCTTVSM